MQEGTCYYCNGAENNTSMQEDEVDVVQEFREVKGVYMSTVGWHGLARNDKGRNRKQDSAVSSLTCMLLLACIVTNESQTHLKTATADPCNIGRTSRVRILSTLP